MRIAIVVAAMALLSTGVLAADKAVSIPKEGTISGRNVTSGSLQIVPLGKEQARGTYDTTGVQIGEGSFLYNASIHCVGGMTIIHGGWDDESGECIYTLPDGDQVSFAYKAAGRAGGESRGTWRFIEGTGKLAGIEGNGEFSRYGVRSAAQGTSQSVSRFAGTYKLPAAAVPR